MFPKDDIASGVVIQPSFTWGTGFLAMTLLQPFCPVLETGDSAENTNFPGGKLSLASVISFVVS